MTYVNGDIGASIANVIKISINYSNSNTYLLSQALQIQTTLGMFSALTLTLFTTSLILYRIIAVTRRANLPKRTQNTYQKVVDVMVQSSALYSVVLLVWAISWAITPASTLSGSLRQIPLGYLSEFIGEICFIVGVRCEHPLTLITS